MDRSIEKELAHNKEHNMAKFKAHHPRSVKATARRVLKKKK
jgi:hypothetical protein